MKKLSFLLAFLFLIATPASASAALINVDLKGKPQWNVLSATDEMSGQIEVKSVVNTPLPDANTQIALQRKDNSVVLDVNGKQTDLSGYTDNIIEIEEKQAPKKISIKALSDGFAILQRGITAVTQFPITLSTPDRKLSVKTPTGVHYISVMPYDAVAQIVRSDVVKDLGADGKVDLVENDNGEIVYKIKGEQEVSIFKFVSIPVSVEAQVSAVNGKVLKVDQPAWYSILDFLLV